MNFLLSSVGQIFSPKDQNQIKKGSGKGLICEISSGSLFFTSRKSSTLQEKLPVYKNCIISIYKHLDKQFIFSLVVSRNLDETEEFDLDSNIPTVDELEGKFLLDRSLMISRDGKTIIWKDIESDIPNSCWNYVAGSKASLDELEKWEEQMYLCLFESATGKRHDSVKPKELTDFLTLYQNEVVQADVGGWKPSDENPFLATPPKKKAEISHSTPVHTPINDVEASKMTFSPFTKHQTGKIPEGTSLVKVPAELFYFDQVHGGFLKHIDQVVNAEIRQTGAYAYYLVVTDYNSKPLILQQLEQQMNPFCDYSAHSFTWVWNDPETGLPFVSWSLHFRMDNQADQSEFNRVFYGSMYESVNREKLQNAKEDQLQYLQQVFQDTDEMDVDLPEEEEEEEEESETRIRDNMNDAKKEDQENDGSKNSLLAVGYRNDRSFVVRGNKIGVFRHDDDNLEFKTSIKNISNLKGEVFSPRKVMLHQEDSKMVLMHPDETDKLHIMDLEYGRVIEEWKVDDNVAVSDIVPDAKYAQQGAGKTLLGINSKALFQIDGRLSGNKLVASTLSQYKTKVDFSAAATTGSGQIAVASQKGEIRLFDRFGLSRAKTTLPGVGDPIIGMDTSEDGKYILATCASYLLVIETHAEGEKKSAFEKSIKTRPKRLQLKPEHVAWMGERIAFTPARFDTGVNCLEKSIITSTGPYVITWNFRKVKSGKLHEYTIKKYGENVVADNFKYGHDKSIIVALPSNVEMVRKSTLQTPTKMLKSNSNIVNSPY